MGVRSRNTLKKRTPRIRLIVSCLFPIRVERQLFRLRTSWVYPIAKDSSRIDTSQEHLYVVLAKRDSIFHFVFFVCLSIHLSISLLLPHTHTHTSTDHARTDATCEECAEKVESIRRQMEGKSILFVDDSIVRGTTSKQLILMARRAGAQNVYFAQLHPQSLSQRVRY